MYRRKHQDEDDNHDRWLISYADFITLLFAFFVVMYATSTINLNKYQALSSAVVTAFQGPDGKITSLGASASTDKPQIGVLKPLPLAHLHQEKKLHEQQRLHALGQRIADVLAPWLEQKLIAVEQGDLGVDITMQNSVLFQADQSRMTDQGPYILKLISEQLRNEYRAIQVEGHADRHLFAEEINGEAKRWETTAMQAARVTSIFVARGMDSKRLSAIGLADTKPASTSDSALAQTINNRLIIRILTSESGAQQAANNTASASIQPENSTTSADTQGKAAVSAP